MNPQGCRTYPFKVPSTKELAHDFLWRIHKCTPGQRDGLRLQSIALRGRAGRPSRGSGAKESLESAVRLINAFEENLVAAGTRILKFYLHISPEEQLERFKKRLDNPDKHWKLNVSDYAARDKWDAYREAYEDAIDKCNSKSIAVVGDSRGPQMVSRCRRRRRSSVRHCSDMDPKMPPVEVDLEEIRGLYERELRERSSRRSKIEGSVSPREGVLAMSIRRVTCPGCGAAGQRSGRHDQCQMSRLRHGLEREQSGRRGEDCPAVPMRRGEQPWIPNLRERSTATARHGDDRRLGWRGNDVDRMHGFDDRHSQSRSAAVEAAVPRSKRRSSRSTPEAYRIINYRKSSAQANLQGLSQRGAHDRRETVGLAPGNQAAPEPRRHAAEDYRSRTDCISRRCTTSPSTMSKR